jgi:hypothetical protein
MVATISANLCNPLNNLQVWPSWVPGNNDITDLRSQTPIGVWIDEYFIVCAD